MPSLARIAIAACLLTLSFLLATGCGGSGSSAAGDGGGPDAGEVTISWQRPASKTDRVGSEALKASEVEALAEAVAKTYELPRGLTIEGVNGDGNKKGATYDPEENSITLPYGFAAITSEAVEEGSFEISAKEVSERVAALNDVIFEHLVGQALIAAYELPAAGDEAKLAGEIGTTLLLESATGAKQATPAAIFLANFSNRAEPAVLVEYVNVHAMDLENALDLLCWSAGSSKQAQREVAEIGAIGDASNCPQEYRRLTSAVAQDLNPHLK